MKQFFLFLLVNMISLLSISQNLNDCTYTYFSSKQKSTSQCWDDKKWEGKAIAYNLKGEIMGEWKLSRMHMISSVQFTFHENGSVKTASYSSHPDAGIQHYHSTTTFDENGNKIDFYEEDFDGHHKVPSVIYRDPEEEKKENEKYIAEQKAKADKLKREADSLAKLAGVKKDSTQKQEVIECAIIYLSELWIENKTGKDITVKFDSKFKVGEKENSLTEVKIKKGEKVKVTQQIQAQFYEDPISRYNIYIWDKKGKKKLDKKLSASPLLDESRLKENRKGFIYEVK